METSALVKIELTVPKSKIRKLKTLLKKEGISVQTTTAKEPKQLATPKKLPYGMRKGKYKKGEKPSDAIKAIADREPEDFTELRRKAWGGRGVH